MVEYVGIRNWKEKATLLRKGQYVLQEVPAEELAFDCVRHIEFLEQIERLPTRNFSDTLYWKYLLSRGRSEHHAQQKCEQFVALYESVRSQGIDYSQGYVAVTEDGIRLNGSHRAAIAYVLGIETLRVRVYKWEEIFPPKRVRYIQEEARLKRDAQKRFLGKRVHLLRKEWDVRRVVFVDVRLKLPVGWRWLRFFTPSVWEPMLVVLGDNGAFEHWLARQVCFEQKENK